MCTSKRNNGSRRDGPGSIGHLVRYPPAKMRLRDRRVQLKRPPETMLLADQRIGLQPLRIEPPALIEAPGAKRSFLSSRKSYRSASGLRKKAASESTAVWWKPLFKKRLSCGKNAPKSSAAPLTVQRPTPMYPASR